MEQEMKERIAKALSRTWDAIAEDCFVGDYGERDTGMIFSRAEVFELTVDRFYMYGEDEEAFEAWKSIKRDDPLRKEIVRIAFPHNSYGH